MCSGLSGYVYDMWCWSGDMFMICVVVCLDMFMICGVDLGICLYV